MLNLSNKAQYFIIASVILAGFFYTLSRFLNPSSFVDNSKSATANEILLFNNFKEKTIKAVQVSDSINRDDLETNLVTYRNYIQKIARENGYNLFFEFVNTTTNVSVNMTLKSDRMMMNTSFVIHRP
ncbi:MAG: hypothetical protein QXM68_01550 [Candidatus Aenigmatarchaeota archaeon]|nr:hypothetical protein [Candidatus Aenigmarchaeota archaeon]